MGLLFFVFTPLCQRFSSAFSPIFSLHFSPLPLLSTLFLLPSLVPSLSAPPSLSSPLPSLSPSISALLLSLPLFPLCLRSVSVFLCHSCFAYLPLPLSPSLSVLPSTAPLLSCPIYPCMLFPLSLPDSPSLSSSSTPLPTCPPFFSLLITLSSPLTLFSPTLCSPCPFSLFPVTFLQHVY